MGAKAKKPAPRSAKFEAMAEYALTRQRERPGLGYAALVMEIRQRFEVGQNSAEIGIKRAYEIRRENTQKLIEDPGIIEDLYWEQFEKADRAGKATDARKILDSLRTMLGIGEPERLEITSGKQSNTKLAHLTPEQIDALAAFDRAGDPSLDDADAAQDSTMPGVELELSDETLAELADAGDAPIE